LRKNSNIKVYVVVTGTFYKTVFILDHINVHETTSYRLESADEAQAVGAEIEQAYQALGFEVVHIPYKPVAKDESLAARAAHYKKINPNNLFLAFLKKLLSLASLDTSLIH